MSVVRKRYQLTITDPKDRHFGRWFGMIEEEELTPEERDQVLPLGWLVQFLRAEDCSECGTPASAGIVPGKIVGYQREVSGMMYNVVKGYTSRYCFSTDELILHPEQILKLIRERILPEPA